MIHRVRATMAMLAWLLSFVLLWAIAVAFFGVWGFIAAMIAAMLALAAVKGQQR